MLSAVFLLIGTALNPDKWSNFEPVLNIQNNFKPVRNISTLSEIFQTSLKYFREPGWSCDECELGIGVKIIGSTNENVRSSTFLIGIEMTYPPSRRWVEIACPFLWKLLVNSRTNYIPIHFSLHNINISFFNHKTFLAGI